VSATLRNEIRRHNKFVMESTFTAAEMNMLYRLPIDLRYKLFVNILNDQISQIPILQKHLHNKVFVIALVEMLEPQMNVAGSVVYKANTPNIPLYFLSSGKVVHIYSYIIDELKVKKKGETKDRTRQFQRGISDVIRDSTIWRTLGPTYGKDGKESDEGIVPGSILRPGMCFGYDHVLDLEYKLGAKAVTNSTMFLLSKKATEDILMSRPAVGERLLKSLKKLIKHQLFVQVNPQAVFSGARVSESSWESANSTNSSLAMASCTFRRLPPTSSDSLEEVLEEGKTDAAQGPEVEGRRRSSSSLKKKRSPKNDRRGSTKSSLGPVQRVKLGLNLTQGHGLNILETDNYEETVIMTSGTMREFAEHWVTNYEERLTHLMNFQRVLRSETFDITDEDLLMKENTKRSAIGFIKMLQSQMARKRKKGTAAFMVAAAKMLKMQEQRRERNGKGTSTKFRKDDMVTPQALSQRIPLKRAASRLKIASSFLSQRKMPVSPRSLESCSTVT